jgi:hypothetical protein
LKQFRLTEYRLDLVQQRQSVLNVSGVGSFDRATQDGDLQMTAQVALDRVSALAAHWVTAVGEYAPSGQATVKVSVQGKQGGKEVGI